MGLRIGKLSRRIRDSASFSVAAVGVFSTALSILGYSMQDCLPTTSIFARCCILIAVTFVLGLLAYAVIGIMHGRSIQLGINGNNVEITAGDIFEEESFRVIGCDTRFDDRIDDTVINRSSLHGQLFLEHSEPAAIIMSVRDEAARRGLSPDPDGRYEFPAGAMVRYRSEVDGATYLLLSMLQLDENNMVHTSMPEYEGMLMEMWREIDRLYAGHDVSLPLLGSRTARFVEGPRSDSELLRCMLCTLNASGARLSCKVRIVIYGKKSDIPLYEYKDLFRTVPARKD